MEHTCNADAGIAPMMRESKGQEDACAASSKLRTLSSNHDDDSSLTYCETPRVTSHTVVPSAKHLKLLAVMEESPFLRQWRLRERWFARCSLPHRVLERVQSRDNLPWWSLIMSSRTNIAQARSLWRSVILFHINVSHIKQSAYTAVGQFVNTHYSCDTEKNENSRHRAAIPPA